MELLLLRRRRTRTSTGTYLLQASPDRRTTLVVHSEIGMDLRRLLRSYIRMMALYDTANGVRRNGWWELYFPDLFAGAIVMILL